MVYLLVVVVLGCLMLFNFAQTMPLHQQLLRSSRSARLFRVAFALAGVRESSGVGSNRAYFRITKESLLDKQVLVSDTNEKVKLLKSLQSKKKRDALSLIVLEGHRQVIDALESGLVPSHVLMTHKALEAAPLSSQLVSILSKTCSNPLDTCVECVSEDVMSKMLSEVEHSQGIVAAFPRPVFATTSFRPSSSQDHIDHSDEQAAALVVLLDRPADPGNVGTIIRTAFGFGAHAVVAVEGCDVMSPKVIRSAMGLVLRLPVLETTWKTAANDVSAIFSAIASSSSSSSSSSSLHYQIVVADADEDAQVYDDVDFSLPSLIVIGSEAHGVSQDALSLRGAKKIRIPMLRKLESLNAATAASIILAEAARQRRLPRTKVKE